MRCAPTLLLVACAAAGAVETVDRSAVDVSDFPIEPMARLRYLDDRIELHPKALVGIGWNSNLFADARDVDAPFYRLLAGLDLRWFVSPRQRIDIDGEIDSQQYLGQSRGDIVGGDGRVLYVRQGEVLGWTAHVGWLRSNQPQEQTGEQITFARMDGDVEADYRGFTSHYVGGVSAERIDYQQDSAFYGQHQRDAWRDAGRLRLGRAYAQDSEWYVRGRLGQTRYDHEDRFQSSLEEQAAVGVEHLLWTRTHGFLDVGVDLRQYDDDFLHDPSYGDKDVVYPIGSLGVRWEPEALSAAQVRLISDVYDSVSSNAAWYYGVEVAGRLRLRERIFAFTEDFVHRAIDSGASAGRTPEHRTTVELAGGLGYALRDGVACRARASWTHSDSDIGQSYERVLLALEVGFAF